MSDAQALPAAPRVFQIADTAPPQGEPASDQGQAVEEVSEGVSAQKDSPSAEQEQGEAGNEPAAGATDTTATGSRRKSRRRAERTTKIMIVSSCSTGDGRRTT